MSGHRCGTTDPGPCQAMCLDPDCPDCLCRTAAFGVLVDDGVAPHKVLVALQAAQREGYNLDRLAEFGVTVRRIVAASPGNKAAIVLAGESSAFDELVAGFNDPPPS